MANYPGTASKLLVIMLRVAASIAIFYFCLKVSETPAHCAVLLPAFANQTAPELNKKVNS
jgi:hypothetical protein